MEEALRPAVAWLAASTEPAVRRAAQLEFLGRPWTGDPVIHGVRCSPVSSGTAASVSTPTGNGPARTGLVSLVDLGITAADARPVLAAAGTVLDWLLGDQHRNQIRSIAGLTRRCASQEGNALYVCSRLGMGTDPWWRNWLTAWSAGNGPTAAGTETPTRAAAVRPSMKHCPPPKGSWRIGGRSAIPVLASPRTGLPSCCWTTGCSGRPPPGAPSTRGGPSSGIRSSGTTAFFPPCCCWPA